METPLRLYALGIVVQGEGRIRRSGRGRAGCHLFLNGDGETAAHVVPVQPDGATGGCVAADAVGDAERGGGQDETGPIFGRSPGSASRTSCVPLPMSRLRIGPAAASRRATASPADAGESSAMTIFLYSG